MKIKAIATMLCIATLGLAVSCTKEEKGNATIIGKWKCIYSLVENYEFRQVGPSLTIDTNIYYDEGKIGKSWEFQQDGYLRRDGMQMVSYTVNGDLLTFVRIEPPLDTVGTMQITELQETWMQLFSQSDTRQADGQGTLKKETYIFSKALVQ